jgi:hypothetical protein
MKKADTLKRGDLVSIDWWDAFSIDPWMSFEAVVDGVKELSLCHTVGYVIVDYETSISICHSFNDDGRVCGSLQIPKCSIKGEIKKL